MVKPNKQATYILFLSIFLNLTGFAILLPLSAALIEYYLPIEAEANTLLAKLILSTKSLAARVGNENPAFTTSVLFGCMLASLYAFLQFLCSPIWGRVSDRYGRRPILLITLLGTVLSYLLWVFAKDFSTFIVSRVCAGVTAGSLAVGTAAIADMTSKENRTKGMALVGVAFSLGFIIGPALGGLLTKIDLSTVLPPILNFSLTPFSCAAFFATLLALINFLWVLFKFEETFPKEKRPLSASLKRSKGFFKVLRSQTRPIFRLNFSYFIFILSISGLEFTLAFLTIDRFAYTAVQIGYLFLYIGVILVLVQGFLVRRLSHKVDERYMALGGAFSGIVAYNVVAFAFEEVAFYIGSGFLAVALGLVAPSLSSLVSLFTEEDQQGESLGFFRSAGALARSCGPLVAAVPFFYFGTKFTYVSMSCLLVLPIVVIFFFVPKPKKEKECLAKAQQNAEILENEEIPSV